MICWICGKEDATATRGFGKRETLGWKIPFEKQRHYCERCLKAENDQLDADKREYVRLKKKLMYQRALNILERAEVDMYEYKEECEAIEEFIAENPNKFDTAHEMIVAIMLLWNRVHAKTQYRVGTYLADFCLPDEKIILEVDGTVHRYNMYRDNKRDVSIRETLGNEWEVVRISNEYVEQNPELIYEAAKTIRDYKKDIRRKNYGLLPEWYSKREKAEKPKKRKDVTIGDDNLFDI